MYTVLFTILASMRRVLVLVLAVTLLVAGGRAMDLEDADSKASECERNLKRAQVENSHFRLEVEDLRTEVDSLRAENNELKEQARDHAYAADMHSQKAATLETMLHELSKELESEKNNHVFTVTELRGWIASLEDQVQAYETELEMHRAPSSPSRSPTVRSEDLGDCEECVKNLDKCEEYNAGLENALHKLGTDFKEKQHEAERLARELEENSRNAGGDDSDRVASLEAQVRELSWVAHAQAEALLEYERLSGEIRNDVDDVHEIGSPSRMDGPTSLADELGSGMIRYDDESDYVSESAENESGELEQCRADKGRLEGRLAAIRRQVAEATSKLSAEKSSLRGYQSKAFFGVAREHRTNKARARADKLEQIEKGLSKITDEGPNVEQ